MAYTYICKKPNGELFALCGNFRDISNKPKYLFPISNEYHKYWIKTPFGFRSNVSTGEIPKKFRIIYQIAHQTVGVMLLGFNSLVGIKCKALIHIKR